MELCRISCMAYLLRRTYAVAAGVLALPFMLFWKDRARFYSYLHPRLVENQRETGVDGSGRKAQLVIFTDC
ncbi:YbfA family protein [Escherichia coli]|nr:YbfA family protein [Escherichia coli]